MSKNKPIYVLYFNGLTNGKTRRREQFAIRYLEKYGIIVEHVSINWRSNEPFTNLLSRLVGLSKTRLEEHEGLVLIGASAGGSLALNVYGQLRGKNLTVVTLCSRLHLAKIPWWDWRSLKRMAYLGTPKASQKFYDSVVYCTKTTIPRLSKNDKKQIIVVRQWYDTVVPRATMNIEGTRSCKLPAIEHGWGIALATWYLPMILKR